MHGNSPITQPLPCIIKSAFWLIKDGALRLDTKEYRITQQLIEIVDMLVRSVHKHITWGTVRFEHNLEFGYESEGSQHLELSGIQ